MPTIPRTYIQRTPLRTPNPGSLTPSLISAGTGSNINPTAAAIRSPGRVQAPVVTPVVEKDLIGPAVADLGKSLGRAAIAWSNDVAELEANDAALEYQNDMRNIWLGTTDGDGNFQPGFAATSGKQSVEKYPEFQQMSAEIRDHYITSLGENSASRFIQKTQGIHNGYLNNGASHAASGKGVWEANQLKEQGAALSIELADISLSPDQVQTKLASYATTVAAKLNPAAADIAIQSFLQQHTSYLASQENSVNKLESWKSAVGNGADQKTMTGINSAIRTQTRFEVTQSRQLAAEQDRYTRESREANGIALRSKVWQGETIPENDLHSMLANRQIDSSTHDYLIFAQREGTNVPPAKGSDLYNYKSKILYDSMDSNDIDDLGLNAQDNRSLHSYLNSTQSQKTNADLRAIRQEFNRLGSNPLYGGGENAIQSATDTAENIYLKAGAAGKPITVYEAVQKGGANYFNTQQMQQISPAPVPVGKDRIVPTDPEQLKRLYNNWKRTSSKLDPDVYSREFNLFAQWRGKFAADTAQKDTRQDQLNETTRQ